MNRCSDVKMKAQKAHSWQSHAAGESEVAHVLSSMLICYIDRATLCSVDLQTAVNAIHERPTRHEAYRAC